MNLVKIENRQMILTEEALEKLQRIHDAEIVVQELKNEKEEITKAIKKAMAENGIKSFECDICKMTYTPAGTRTSVDTEKLKADGVYEDYIKIGKTADKLTITYKDAD